MIHTVVPYLNKIMGFAEDTPLMMYEVKKKRTPPLSSPILPPAKKKKPPVHSVKFHQQEIKPTMIDTILLNHTFHAAELDNGDIICFQKPLPPYVLFFLFFICWEGKKTPGTNLFSFLPSMAEHTTTTSRQQSTFTVTCSPG